MLTSVLDHLKSFDPADVDQAVLRTAYLEAISEAGEKMLWKGLADEHVTASCFVFSEDLDQILLTFHRKGQFWVQFGGHLEKDDDSLEASALREAREESGIESLQLTGGVVDLDLHRLHGGFTCAAHWDIGFTALVSADAEFGVSDESESVEWWSVDQLPESAPPDLARRIERALKSLQATD